MREKTLAIVAFGLLAAGCAAQMGEDDGLGETTQFLEDGSPACSFVHQSGDKLCDGKSTYSSTLSIELQSQTIHVNGSTEQEARKACRRYMINNGSGGPDCPKCPGGATGCDDSLTSDSGLPNVSHVSGTDYTCSFPSTIGIYFTCSICVFSGIACEEFAPGELEAMTSIGYGESSID